MSAKKPQIQPHPAPAGRQADEQQVAGSAARSVPVRGAWDAAARVVELASASPISATRAARQLQRRRGNTAMMHAARQAAPIVQAKLVTSAPGDRYEQEADRAAAQIPLTSAQLGSLQRATLSAIQPGVVADAGVPVTPDVEAGIQAARGGGQPLPEGVRGQMEGALGADFAGVRLHTGPQAHALNEALQARAFTTGRDIFFREDEYQPGSSSGQGLLAHELTHVVQQGGQENAHIQRLKIEGRGDIMPDDAYKLLTAEKRFSDQYTAIKVPWSETDKIVKQILTEIHRIQSNIEFRLDILHESVMTRANMLLPLIKFWNGSGVFWFESDREFRSVIDPEDKEGSIKEINKYSMRDRHSAPNKTKFFEMLFKAYIKSANIRNLVMEITQETNNEKFIVVVLPTDREFGFIDSFLSDVVNTEDLQQFPDIPRPDRQQEITQGEHIAHILYERRQHRKEKGGTLAEYISWKRQISQKAKHDAHFEHYHTLATSFHSQYRREQGQLVGVEEKSAGGVVTITFPNGDKQTLLLGHSGEIMRNEYKQALAPSV